MSTSARVLFVDDHAANKALYEAVCAQLGKVEAIFYTEGQAALDWASRHASNLLVVDYSMPSMNGIEFVRKLRLLAGWSKVPVIMLTGMNSALVRDTALDAGVNVFLPKPIDKRRFLDEARRLMENAAGQAL